MLKQMVAVVVVVAGVAAGCSPGDQGVPSDSILACLDPRAPQARPEEGWLVEADYPYLGPQWSPFADSAGLQTDSKGLDKVVQAVRRAVGEGFTLERASEYPGDDSSCVTDRFITVSRADGARVSLIAAQLRQRVHVVLPVRDPHLTSTEDGDELMVDAYDAVGSATSALHVGHDGLAVYLRARSATAPSISGWPTTTSPTTAAGPPAPSPFTREELGTIVQKVAASIR